MFLSPQFEYQYRYYKQKTTTKYTHCSEWGQEFVKSAFNRRLDNCWSRNYPYWCGLVSMSAGHTFIQTKLKITSIGVSPVTVQDLASDTPDWLVVVSWWNRYTPGSLRIGIIYCYIVNSVIIHVNPSAWLEWNEEIKDVMSWLTEIYRRK